MTLTLEQLQAIMPYAGKRAAVFLEPLNEAMRWADINTPKRMAAFLAQIAHESGELRYVRELASGEAYDTGRLAARLGNTAEADGDGQRFKGRGLIQITGRANYEAASEALEVDFVANPELMETPHYAAMVSAWFWMDRSLGLVADRGDFERLTRRINGGLNGYTDRLRYWAKAKEVLGVAA